MKRQHGGFNADTIIKVIAARRQGLSQRDAAAQAGLAITSITKWLQRGRKDIKDGQVTAHGEFARVWDSMRGLGRGRGATMEVRRWAEWQKAASTLEVT